MAKPRSRGKLPTARHRVRIKTPPLLFDATQRVIASIQRSVVSK